MAPFLRFLLKSFRTQRFRPWRAAVPALVLAMLAPNLPACAQTGPAVEPSAAPRAAKSGRAPAPKAPAAKTAKAATHKPNPYGSPLDTLMSTRIWADVPPAQPFVQQSRPDPKSLDYTPLTRGPDPERPKPRDAKGIAALQAELEAGGTMNATRAKGLQPPPRAARRTRKVSKVSASGE